MSSIVVQQLLKLELPGFAIYLKHILPVGKIYSLLECTDFLYNEKYIKLVPVQGTMTLQMQNQPRTHHLVLKPPNALTQSNA